MVKSILLVQVLIIILSLTSSCLQLTLAQVVEFSPESVGETFRNLISGHSHLLLGSSEAIYRLDDSLERQQKRALSAPNRLLVADYQWRI